MGRPKKNQEEVIEKVIVDDEISLTEREIEALYGEGIFIDGDAILSKPKQIIPLSPCLDIGLSGGIPEGSWVVFTGPEKCGKTTSALHFAANAQQEKYGGRKIFYLDIEGRLKKMNLTGIPGLKLSKPHFNRIGSVKGKILNAQDYLSIGEKIIHNEPGSVLIIDSFSALCTDTELTSELTDQQRADSQKLQAKFIRRTANVVPVNDIIVIGITHIMSNPSGYGAGKVEKTANAVKYQGDVKLHAKEIEAWMDADKQIGQIVNWQVVFSALGPPGAKIKSYIRYGQGIDVYAELVQVCSEIGLIKKGGSWYTFENDGVEVKKQGLEQMQQHLRDNPVLFDKLYEQLKEMLS